jgi:hypothetical protein
MSTSTRSTRCSCCLEEMVYAERVFVYLHCLTGGKKTPCMTSFISAAPEDHSLYPPARAVIDDYCRGNLVYDIYVSVS